MAFAGFAAFAGSSGNAQLAQNGPSYGTAYSNARVLDQGWSEEDRLKHYFMSQGSAAMSYDIFLNLETANTEALLRSDSEVARYGAIPHKADPVYNPDGLPIGFVKTSISDGQRKGDWIGLGCAACHNGRLQFQGQQITISGGTAAGFDFYDFIGSVDASIAATLDHEGKFSRLAERIGGDREAVRVRLEADALAISTYITDTALTPHLPGPGRVDALGLIHNQVQMRSMGVPQNWSAALAPTKPSFAWNIPQSAWAQWTGIIPDPLVRNASEVMGVFARMDLQSETPEEGLFQSTLDLGGQIASEELLRRLAPPPWPEDLLGEIRKARSAVGAVLFSKNCASCHSTYPHRWSEPRGGLRFIENAIIMGEVIGTDPMQFRSPQFDSLPTARSGDMADKLFAPFTGLKVLPPTAIFGITLQPGIINTALAKLNLTAEEEALARTYAPTDPEEALVPPVIGGYKANPIEGMWSSAPFLHNGSVPTLYDLLLPASERPKTFFVGREFDPVKVGVDTSGNSGTFEFDTSLVGNSNAGHSFEDAPLGNGVIGRALSEDERWALIEYVKSVPNAPAQITPFGGPEDPVSAWKDPSFYHVTNPGTYEGVPDIEPAPAQVPEPPILVPALDQEVIEPDEQENIDAIMRLSMDRLKSKFPDGKRPVLRDAHPKAHGLVSAESIVLDDVPDYMRHGIFKEPRTYDALIRFSAGNVEVQPDTIPQAAGMAIKLLGVQGEKLLQREADAQTQDFIMINAPTFFTSNLADYVVLHGFLQQGKLTEFFKTRPVEMRAATMIREQRFFNPLQARYWSMTPYLLGERAIKFSAIPISRTTNQPPETMGPDFLREVMMEQIGREDVYFEFSVQLQADPVSMPIEDPVVLWDEAEAPFQRVALIRIPAQDISSDAWVEFGENLSFTPWHSWPEHQPLGSNNRVRLKVYEAISDLRHEMNDVQTREPTEMPPR